jgi:hypothetical protein
MTISFGAEVLPFDFEALDNPEVAESPSREGLKEVYNA